MHISELAYRECNNVYVVLIFFSLRNKPQKGDLLQCGNEHPHCRSCCPQRRAKVTLTSPHPVPASTCSAAYPQIAFFGVWGAYVVHVHRPGQARGVTRGQHMISQGKRDIFSSLPFRRERRLLPRQKKRKSFSAAAVPEKKKKTEKILSPFFLLCFSLKREGRKRM